MTEMNNRYSIFSSRPALSELVSKLHALSESQEQEFGSIKKSFYPQSAEKSDLAPFADKLVALDQDKAEAMYMILRATNAQRIFEAGTSYGVSTMYLISAMRDNIQQNGVKQHAQKDLTPKVWGTENEENKAKVARENLMNAFSANGEWKDILERNHFEFLLGDIIENISKQHFLPSSIDALLLDIWAPVALPTLVALSKALRPGATVFIDNSKPENKRYTELHRYLNDARNGWKSVVLPFNNGFEMAIKVASDQSASSLSYME